MRNSVKVYHILVGILLALSTAFQLLAMFGGVLFNDRNDFTVDMPWLVPVWGGMLALLIAAYVLVLKKGRQYPWQPILFTAALVAAIAALVVAFTLRDALPDHLSIDGGSQGLNSWKLLYRHLSSALVGVLIAVEAGVQWAISARAREKAAETDVDPAQSTIGLEFFGGDEAAAKPKKLKRSLRRAKQKAQTDDTAE